MGVFRLVLCNVCACYSVHWLHIVRTVRSVLKLNENLAAMFPREEIWRCAVFGAIGGIITLVILKLLENKETPPREIREQDDLTEPRNQPQEHDERFC